MASGRELRDARRDGAGSELGIVRVGRERSRVPIGGGGVADAARDLPDDDGDQERTRGV
jgi:hypothetical protein